MVTPLSLTISRLSLCKLTTVLTGRPSAFSSQLPLPSPLAATRVTCPYEPAVGPPCLFAAALFVVAQRGSSWVSAVRGAGAGGGAGSSGTLPSMKEEGGRAVCHDMGGLRGYYAQ